MAFSVRTLSTAMRWFSSRFRSQLGFLGCSLNRSMPLSSCASAAARRLDSSSRSCACCSSVGLSRASVGGASKPSLAPLSLWARLEGQTTDEPAPSGFSATAGPGRGFLMDLLPHKTVADMRARWLTISAADRKRYWPHTMLATMDLHPDRTAQVLEATFDPKIALDWEVTDVVCFIARWTSQLPKPDSKTHQALLPGLVLYLLRNTRPKWLLLHQWVLGQAISVCDASTAADLCVTLEKYSHKLHFNTKLKLAHRLSKDTEYKLMALRLLESVIANDGLSANDRRCAALATSLLQLPPTWKQGRAPLVEMTLIAEVYERLVPLGFSPNSITAAALVRSLCLSGQLETAFKVYDVMRGQWGDYRIFTYLLRGAARTGSLEAVVRIVQGAPVKILEDPYVWHEVIHTIHSAAKNEAKLKRHRYADGNPAFHSMLRVYCKFFDIAPLQRLIPLDLDRYLHEGDRKGNLERWEWEAKLAVLIDKLPNLPRGKAVVPQLGTMGTMLLGYSRSFPEVRRAMYFYSHFRKLLRVGDRTAIRLLRQTTLPYDLVLKSLSEHPGTLRVMTDIVKDMLQDATSSVRTLHREAKPSAVAETVSSGSTREATLEDAVREDIDNEPEEHNQDPEHKEPTTVPIHHPPPSVRGARNAPRILDLMRANGIQPNRDLKRITGALHLLETDGYQPDAHTLHAVARLRHSQDILDQMEDRIEQRGLAYLERVAELAEPPVSLIDQMRQERERRRAEASGSAGGQQQPDQQRPQPLQRDQQVTQEANAGEAAAKQDQATNADADVEAGLQELEDAHDAMLRAAEAAARANPVSKTVPSAVRAAKRKNARAAAAAADAPPEEVAAYMEMYDELVFEQMKEELTGFGAGAGDGDGDGKTRVAGEGVSGGEQAGRGDSARERER
ncbi:hypothetical protein N658DRAFT_514053 [Parathielavia hyrcaniae]|uniref:Pentatricopeptide repeat protein n=1 Tax=Parathielavia hyrcaniae TaxID=113614 RepID=A0AAN6T3S4_9PEZI|nr:hypothetical protein N658DRAFT_514053 [Parathielavia hyrcaniae]